MDNEELGRELRAFLDGILNSNVQTNSLDNNRYSTNKPDRNNINDGKNTSYPTSVNSSSNMRSVDTSSYKLVVNVSRAVNINPNYLLVVYISEGKCFLVNPETNETFFFFEVIWGPRTFLWKAICDDTGIIYCTVSGTISIQDPIKAQFGNWGAIIRIDPNNNEVSILEEKFESFDPYDIRVLNSSQLLVTDFNAFGGTGRVYSINKFTKEVKINATGGYLIDPVSSILDENEIVWVANSNQNENSGQIIKISPDGLQEVVYESKTAAVVGVLQSTRSEEIIVFQNDWPFMKDSAVLKINKDTYKVTPLFSANEKDRRFYCTNGDIANGILWIGESVDKAIIGFDLDKETIIKKIDFINIMGGYKGMIDSYDGIESISVIPKLK